MLFVMGRGGDWWNPHWNSCFIAQKFHDDLKQEQVNTLNTYTINKHYINKQIMSYLKLKSIDYGCIILHFQVGHLLRNSQFEGYVVKTRAKSKLLVPTFTCCIKWHITPTVVLTRIRN